jgi:hypothetical protein
VTAVTSPVALIVATVGVPELHVTFGELVRFSVSPLEPATPRRTSWLVWPEAVRDKLDGSSEREVYCSEAPAETVKVASPVTTDPVVASV